MEDLDRGEMACGELGLAARSIAVSEEQTEAMMRLLASLLTLSDITRVSWHKNAAAPTGKA